MQVQSKSLLTFVSSINQFLRVNNTQIANHLIVILAFFLPTFESARTSIIFILIILLFFKNNLLSSLKDILKNKVVQAFILFWLINLLLAFFSTEPSISIPYVKSIKFFLYPVLLLLFLDKAYIPRIIGAFLLGMLISELISYGLVFNLYESVPFGIHHASAEDPSPFLYHMGYGFILAFTATLLLQRALQTTYPIQRILYGIFFITVSINVFVNAGRTGYVIYAIAIMTLLLQMYRKQFLKILLSSTVFLIIVYSLAFQFSPMFQQRMGLAITSVKNILYDGNLNSSIGWRVAMGGMAIETIKDRPIIGYGPNIASSAVSQKARDINSSIKYLHNIPFTHIDNQYLETLVTIGFLGFFFLLNMFVQVFRYKQKDETLKIIQITLLVLTMAYGIEATVITDMGFIPKLFVIFTTFTLVTENRFENLKKVNVKSFSYYAIASLSILMISKIT